MHRNYFFVVLAIALLCIFLIFYSFWWSIDIPEAKEAIVSPPRPTYQSYIAGVGVIEPKSGNIYIGTPIKRIVENVSVTVGEKVKKGDLLFQLENRDLKANLQIEKIAYETALAKFERLKALPRNEEIAAAQAALSDAKAALELSKSQYEMINQLPDPRAVSKQEKNRRYYELQQAEAKFLQAQSDYNLKKEGAWGPDLKIAQLATLQAKANVKRVLTEMEQTAILSPIDGTVLQIKIHNGEFPPLDTSKNPLMILGDIDEMYLRVSINQLDIPKFRENSSAVAYLQDDTHNKFPLEFVRIEPYLVAKQNMTHEIGEIVDTQVLQVIYRIKDGENNLYIGQQMDIFIEVTPHHED